MNGKKRLHSMVLVLTALILFLISVSSTASAAFLTCDVVGTHYQCSSWSNEQYPLINVFGDYYVPLLDNNDPIWKCHAEKLSKLVLDSNDAYTLKTGEILDLGQGYTLVAKQVDVDGKKVWLEFDKNGQYVDDAIISTDNDQTWTCTLDNIEGVNDVPVLKVHVNQIYQDATDSTVQIDGLWLVDYANSMTFKIGDEFRNLTLAKIINGVDASKLGGLVFEENVYAYVTNYGSSSISIINTATNKVVASINLDSCPGAVAVSPDGNKVYVANYGNISVPGNTVSIIDATTNTVQAIVKVGTYPEGVAVSPDGKYVYVANYGNISVPGNTVSIIDATTNTVKATVPVGNNPRGVAVAPDGTQVYVANAGSSSISIIDTITNTVIDTITLNASPTGIAVNLEGTRVYVTSYLNTVYVLDIVNNTITPVKVGKWPFGIAVTPNGKKVYVANYESTTVSVINSTTNTVIKTVNVGTTPQGVAITPDGKKVYVANYASKNVSVLDTTTDKVIATVEVGGNPNAFGQFIVPAPSNFYTIEVVSTNYKYSNWGQYPLINLFGTSYVPLFSNGDPVWKSHVDKLAKLIIDSKDIYTFNNGGKFNLSQGYSLQIKQIDVDGQKVWLEFDRNGQYVDDAIISINDDQTWTCTLDNIEGVNDVPVLKVHVNQIYQDATDSTVQIDGLWLIDYANAKTIKIGSYFGFLRNYKLIKIINGTDASNLGKLIFKFSPFIIKPPLVFKGL